MKKNITSNQGLVVIKPKALAPPPVIPKMSKSDIIEAMVERAKEKHQEEKDAYEVKNNDLIARMNTEAKKCIMDMAVDMSFEVEEPYRSYTELPKFISVKTEVSSPVMKALIKEWGILKKTDPSWFCERSTKDKIKASMDGKEDRVKLILAQPENVETIDGLLKKIFIKKGE